MKILSIRGGGIRGLAPATFLQALEASTGKKCSELFDLIVGTSTGAILAIGLGLGLPAGKLVDFYYDDAPLIFKRRMLHYFGLTKAKYDGDVLEARLSLRYGALDLDHCVTHTMVTASNLNTLGATFIKSWEHGEVPAALAARASAAAPTYFDPAVLPAFGKFPGGTFGDGGLFANNPALFALVEADLMSALPEAHTLIDLGCPVPAPKPVTGAGAVHFVPEAIATIFDLGMDATVTACRELVPAFRSIVPLLGDASPAIDDVSVTNLHALSASGNKAWSDRGDSLLNLLREKNVAKASASSIGG